MANALQDAVRPRTVVDVEGGHITAVEAQLIWKRYVDRVVVQGCQLHRGNGRGAGHGGAERRGQDHDDTYAPAHNPARPGSHTAILETLLQGAPHPARLPAGGAGFV